MKTEKQLIEEANSIIRSFASIAEREGIQTNWEALKKNLAVILEDQRKYMYPEQYSNNEHVEGEGNFWTEFKARLEKNMSEPLL